MQGAEGLRLKAEGQYSVTVLSKEFFFFRYNQFLSITVYCITSLLPDFPTPNSRLVFLPGLFT